MHPHSAAFSASPSSPPHVGGASASTAPCWRDPCGQTAQRASCLCSFYPVPVSPLAPSPLPTPAPSPRPRHAQEGSNAPAALAERDSGLDLSVKVDLTLGTTAWQKLCSRQGPPSSSPPFSCAVSLSAQGPCARRAPLSRCSPPAASAPEPSRRPPPRGLRLTWEQKWPMGRFLAAGARGGAAGALLGRAVA